MELRFVQKFGAGCTDSGPLCDEECVSRSVALYADENNKAYALCEKHRAAMGAPVPPVGVEYQPTGMMMVGWYMENGTAVQRKEKNASL
jgi:hypothetical protein